MTEGTVGNIQENCWEHPKKLQIIIVVVEEIWEQQGSGTQSVVKREDMPLNGVRGVGWGVVGGSEQCKIF